MTDNNVKENNRHLPHVGRVRGLIAVWQQTRWEAEMWLRRKGIWSLSPVYPGHGTAVTLALLSKVATKNAVRALIPFPIRGGEEEEV